MTFTVNRKALLDELALLQTVAEKRTTMPILEYIKFELTGEALRLTATSIDVSIVTQVAAQGEAWTGCLPSSQLYALVKLLGGETVDFKPDNDRVIIKWDKSKHKIPSMPVTDFPDVRQYEAEGFTVDATTLSSMLDHVAFAVLTPADDIKQTNRKYTGVSLTVKDKQLQLAATNITRFAAASCAVETDLTTEVIIPNQALGPLTAMRDGTLTVSITPNYAHFTNGQRHLYTLLIDDKFPDWKSLFPSSYPYVAEIESGPLGTAIKRAMLTQNERRNMIMVGLRWTWANDELLIETKGGDLGKSDEVVAINCPSLNGSSIMLGMNGQQVIDVLPLLGERLTCGFSDSTFIVELKPQQPSPINFVYYINTVTLKHWQ